MPSEESQVLVIYDIPSDKIRNRLGNICKDYGLTRIQYSGFCGFLSRNKREELYLRLKDTIGDAIAKLVIQPICNRCSAAAFALEKLPEKPQGGDTAEKTIKEVSWVDLWNSPLKTDIKQDKGYE